MANGTFTPQPIIANRSQLGNRLLQQAAVGQPNVSGLSPFANLLQGLQGGFERGSAQSALRQNQALQTEATKGIGEALARGDLSGASAAAIGSGVPSLFGPGVTLAGQGRAEERAAAARTTQAQQAADKLALERRKVAVLERGGKPTSLVRNLEAAGLKRGTPEFQEAVLAGVNKPLVSVQPAGAKKFAQELNKGSAKNFQAAQEQARQSNARLVDFDILEQSLSNEDVFTGKGGEAINALKQFGQTFFGLNFQGVADAEVASRVSKRLALGARKDLPGSMSNQDRQVLVRLPPGLSVSPEGNRRLIAIERLKIQRDNEIARIYREGLREDGSFDTKGVADNLAELDRETGRRISSQVREMRAVAAQSRPRSPLAGLPPIDQWNLNQINKATKREQDFTLEQLKAMRARRDALRAGGR